MAKEELISQRNKTDTSALRNRKIHSSTGASSQSPNTPVAKDNSIQNAGRLSEDDTQSSNGSSAQFFGGGSNESPSKLLLMLVVGLSFSTRLYKITEPPHVW